MKLMFNEKDIEEMIGIAEQNKILIPSISYNDSLIKELFDCIKNKTNLTADMIKKAHNNYIAQPFYIGLNNCDTPTFNKLDEEIDRMMGRG